MQIYSRQQTQVPNFKAINYVQIPKKVFSNSNNRAEVTKVFQKRLERATRDPLKGFLGSLIAIFGGKRFAKVGILSDN